MSLEGRRVAGWRGRHGGVTGGRIGAREVRLPLSLQDQMNPNIEIGAMDPTSTRIPVKVYEP